MDFQQIYLPHICFQIELKYLEEFGKSNRVPDARELYNTKYKKLDDGTMKRIVNGNPDLDQTQTMRLTLDLKRD